MRDSGNLQQQPMMMKIGSGARQLMIYLFAGSLLATTACTRMPLEQNLVKPVQVSTGKIQLVAQTLVGTTTRYVDPASGAAVEISVLSEYFSAGGRKCRRFSQSSSTTGQGNGQDTGANSELGTGELLTDIPGSVTTTKGLACEDSSSGWIEIPLNAIAG